MPWSSLTAGAYSFTATTAFATTWSGSTSSTVPWAQVSAQAAAPDGGVDFELRISQSAPMLISADRSLEILSSISEGRP